MYWHANLLQPPSRPVTISGDQLPFSAQIKLRVQISSRGMRINRVIMHHDAPARQPPRICKRPTALDVQPSQVISRFSRLGYLRQAVAICMHIPVHPTDICIIDALIEYWVLSCWVNIHSGFECHRMVIELHWETWSYRTCICKYDKG